MFVLSYKNAKMSLNATFTRATNTVSVNKGILGFDIFLLWCTFFVLRVAGRCIYSMIITK